MNGSSTGRASLQAAQEARRASDAAEIEDKIQAVRAEAAAKLAAQRAIAEAAIEAQRKRDTIVEEATRAEQRNALKGPAPNPHRCATPAGQQRLKHRQQQSSSGQPMASTCDTR